MLADNGSTVVPSQTNHDNQTQEPSKAEKSKGVILDSVAELHTTHKSIKGPSSLTRFTLTIENSNTSNYSTGEKGERGKRKQSLFLEGTLLWYFFLPSYLSKHHKCNCLSKTNEAVKSHRPRYRLAFIDLWIQSMYFS